MTPEQKALFEKTMNDLKLPEGELPSDAALPEQPEEKQVELDEVQVELPPDFDGPAAAPVAEVMAAFDEGAGQTTTFGFEGMTAGQQKLQEKNEEVKPLPKNEPAQVNEGFGEFAVFFPPEKEMDRNEAAAAGIPQMEEFMRDMDKQGKLNKEGFLNDEKEPVKINPDDIEDLQANKDNLAGDAMIAWMKAQEAWQAEIIRAFRQHTLVTQKNTATLRAMTDGLERGEV